MTARRTRLQELADEGNRRARLVLQDHERSAALHRGHAARRHRRQPGYRCSRRAGAAPACSTRWWRPSLAWVFAFLILTFFHVVIGELMPKGLALAYSERVALAVAAPVRAFFFVFKPLIWVLQRSSDAGLHGARAPAALGRGRACSRRRS